MTNNEVAEVVMRASEVSVCVKELMAASHKRWMTRVVVAVDDTSIIVVKIE